MGKSMFLNRFKRFHHGGYGTSLETVSLVGTVFAMCYLPNLNGLIWTVENKSHEKIIIWIYTKKECIWQKRLHITVSGMVVERYFFFSPLTKKYKEYKKKTITRVSGSLRWIEGHQKETCPVFQEVQIHRFHKSNF